MPFKILIIEDEPAIADTVKYVLTQEGLIPGWATTLESARQLLQSQSWDLLILDVGLPDGSGFEFCKELRKTSNTPILFLTARQQEIDRIIGLEIGGDDYVTKPFSPREVVARVKSILRRTTTSLSGTVVESQTQLDAEFTLNLDSNELYFNGIVLELTRNEFHLIKHLLQNPKKVYSRSALMNAVWEVPESSSERTVDAHIKSIRKKIKAIDPDWDRLKTQRGFGYSMEAMA
jgi:two-component system catabolic regulation response regulator CreB